MAASAGCPGQVPCLQHTVHQYVCTEWLRHVPAGSGLDWVAGGWIRCRLDLRVLALHYVPHRSPEHDLYLLGAARPLVHSPDAGQRAQAGCHFGRHLCSADWHHALATAGDGRSDPGSLCDLQVLDRQGVPHAAQFGAAGTDSSGCPDPDGANSCSCRLAPVDPELSRRHHS